MVNAKRGSPVHDQGHRFAAAQAKGRQSGFFVLPDHFMNQGDQHPTAGGTDGMAQSHAAAIDIDPGRV